MGSNAKQEGQSPDAGDVPSLRRPMKTMVYLLSGLLFYLLIHTPNPNVPEKGPQATVIGRFQFWMYNRIKTYAVILIGLIFTLYLYGIIQSVDISVQVYGLLLDMLGALIIARGLFRGPPGIWRDADIPKVHEKASNVNQRPSGMLNSEKRSLDSEYRKTVDAIIGAFLLANGFLIQIVGIIMQ
jgi:hypothetical protein